MNIPKTPLQIELNENPWLGVIMSIVWAEMSFKVVVSIVIDRESGMAASWAITGNEKTNKNKRIQNLRFIEAMLNYQLRLDISSLSFAAFS